MVRSATAGVLGWETSKIKVIPAEIGGGFGGKTTIYLEPLAVKLSQKADRPVKMVMTRDEVFRATGPTPGTKIHVKIGVKNNGEITAGKAWLAYESGAFPGSWAKLGKWCVFACYNIPNIQIEALEVLVNKPVNIAYRAPSAPMAAFATETVLDQIAKKIKMDPIEIRLLNAVEEGDYNHSEMVGTFQRIGLKETLEAIRNHPNYKIPLGPNQGRGIATGFWFNIAESSSATVNLTEDGKAVVITGSPDIGGSRASMALMAAEELGIDTKFIKLSGQINDERPKLITKKLNRYLIKNKKLKNISCLVIGIAYKKNCDDLRLSPALKIIDILNKSKKYKINILDDEISKKAKSNFNKFKFITKKQLNKKTLGKYDFCLIVTDNSNVNYEIIRK